MSAAIAYSDGRYFFEYFIFYFTAFSVFLLTSSAKSSRWYYWPLGMALVSVGICTYFNYSDNLHAFIKLIPGAFILGLIFRSVKSKSSFLLPISLAITLTVGGKIFWFLYETFFPQQDDGGFFGWGSGLTEVFTGIIVAHNFIIPFLFTSFGDKHKYYWIGVLLLPVLWFVVKFDLAHWYFYLVVALVGWVLGWGISKLLSFRAQTPK